MTTHYGLTARPCQAVCSCQATGFYARGTAAAILRPAALPGRRRKPPLAGSGGDRFKVRPGGAEMIAKAPVGPGNLLAAGFLCGSCARPDAPSQRSRTDSPGPARFQKNCWWLAIVALTRAKYRHGNH
jgi:hypothetical protein